MRTHDRSKVFWRKVVQFEYLVNGVIAEQNKKKKNGQAFVCREKKRQQNWFGQFVTVYERKSKKEKNKKEKVEKGRERERESTKKEWQAVEQIANLADDFAFNG